MNNYNPAQSREEAEAEMLWRYKIQTEIDTQNKITMVQAKTDAEIYKATTKAQLDIDKAKGIAEARSDVAARKEMQVTDVTINRSGEIWISQKLFSGEMKGRLNVTFVCSAVCVPADDSEDDAILVVQFMTVSGKELVVLFDLYENDEKKIAERFTRAGVSFGFKPKREREMLVKLFALVKETNDVWKIPLKHGWNINRDESGITLSFVYPDEKTWDEVKDYAKRRGYSLSPVFKDCLW